MLMSKNRFLYILPWIALLLSACQQEQESAISKGEVEVRFDVPNSYVLGAATTRAEQTHVPAHLQLIPLPVGSTLWIMYDVLNADGTTWTTCSPKPYIVRSENGYFSLQACQPKESTDDGVTWLSCDDTDTGVPLFLPDGTYRFRMISPALPLVKDKMYVRVDNGQTFYANDDRYVETAVKEVVISTASDKVRYISLPPMINQTARFTITMTPGKDITTLKMMPKAIEISGLQSPYSVTHTDGIAHNWCPQDSLVARAGDKQEWVKLADTDFETRDDGALYAEVGVLPTNAFSTMLTFLINCSIDGVPTQYMFNLNEMLIEQNHSYNISITIDGKDDITISSWSATSWVVDVSPD